MKNIRETFKTPVKLELPHGVFEILRDDACDHGYIKNGEPNINGYLNRLLPALSDNLNDLHTELIKHYGGDERFAKIAIQGIYHVYLKRSAFQSGGRFEVSLRVNQSSYEDFITIHDERLALLDMDFRKYARTLLKEYTAKSLPEREELFAYRLLADVKKSIGKNQCKQFSFYHNDIREVFAPVVIEQSLISDRSYVFGFAEDHRMIAVRVLDLQQVNPTNRKMEVTEEMACRLVDYVDEVFEKEGKKCLA